jgi:hypothetical protein
VDIKFSDAMLKDLQQNTQMYIDLFNTSLVSQHTAIANIFNRDDEMVKKELKRINDEQDEKLKKQQLLSLSPDTNGNN